MNELSSRILAHWKTTAAGVLSVAAVVFGVFATSYPSAKWVGVGGAIVAGLTGLLAKDS